ncbi:hypothetical protein N7476_011044 [Penicillium atrosanguineum]|uniref:N-acetyltransferase domain-containing protein n=1 Tax=Penicillium atrosanguineum TaxID=1132637 RepID=A0A9W9PLT1_9EURO|nr:hypothetical protein N7526_010325 [Penicillium atrosanguineum]KAJ5299487.1 hypothetical protein N7476_011044 [Penicillium atrosanguineum]
METARLRLDPIGLHHLDGFHRIWTNPDATRWATKGTLKTIDQTYAWLSGMLPENRPGSNNYAIFIKNANSDERAVIGVVGVHRIDPTPEIGYILHPAAWGKGYATEAVAAFIQHFWQARPDLDTIEAKVDEENLSSRRILYKCGFVQSETIIGGAERAWLDPPKRNIVIHRLKRT